MNSWKMATAGLAVALVGAVAWGMTHARGPAQPTQHSRFSLGLPDSAALNAATFYRSFDLSPDGTQLAYVGATGLFIRPLNSLTPHRLTSESAVDPRFSPDGAWVAYVSGVTLRKIPVVGGAPKTIVDSVGRFGWSPNGSIVFTKSGQLVPELWRVNENGGRPDLLAHQKRPKDRGYGTPSFIDGDTFLVPLVTAPGDSTEIITYRISDSTTTYLGLMGGHPIYLRDMLVFVDKGNVQAAPFDRRARRAGVPSPIMQGVMSKLSSTELAVSSTGTIAFGRFFAAGIASPFEGATMGG
jgi:hypothetical protein